MFRTAIGRARKDRPIGLSVSEFLDALPGLWASFDADGQLLLVNETGIRIVGHVQDWWTNALFSDLYPESEAERIVGDALNRALAAGHWTGRAMLRTAGERLLPTDQKILAHPSPDGGARAFSLIATQASSAEDPSLAETMRNRRENVVAMSLGIVHDMNNLLAPIAAYANLLTEGPLLDARTRTYLLEIETAARRGRALSSRLLDLAKQRPIEWTRVDMIEIATEVCHSLRVSRPDLNVEFHTELVSAVVEGDPVQLHQLVMNIGRNATEALSDRTGHVELALRVLDGKDPRALADTKGKCLELCISDDGRGIDAADVPRVFEPFYTTRPSGSGLGLRLAHDIALAHRGLLTLEHRNPTGVLVRIHLPLAEPS